MGKPKGVKARLLSVSLLKITYVNNHANSFSYRPCLAGSIYDTMLGWSTK